jgi:hypothetical protein
MAFALVGDRVILLKMSILARLFHYLYSILSNRENQEGWGNFSEIFQVSDWVNLMGRSLSHPSSEW